MKPTEDTIVLTRSDVIRIIEKSGIDNMAKNLPDVSDRIYLKTAYKALLEREVRGD